MAPGGLRALILDPGKAHFGASGGPFSLQELIFEAAGQQETKRQKGRTCKTCNALKLNPVFFSISQVFTPSNLLSFASTALYTKPNRFLSLLLAALPVPMLAQV